ncbi:replicative DNA helicase [Halalkalibacterium halodurans]|uniref:replicative DNA helicase n=1 Tax=Halalkalibacterium halodurans TaxID=86665 RepID=UPI002E24DBDC|nr:replicative DNA helicase [Halalkalibacterium halodurans]MED4105533.1 replicative DNA helicase [Halalkalibacterium halodurans]MED4109261.1 replicative DNA helicase [Halalkalibacterium halodurans]MED4149725.1 replicative DNA helicase [Halalkalibacterium halodurans]
MGDQYNVIAELELFGCILLDNSIIKQLELQPEHFSLIHRAVFQAMRKIDERGERIDYATLYAEMGESAIAQVDLLGAMESVASTEAYSNHERLIIKAWKQRQAQEKVSEFASTDQLDEESINSLITDLTNIQEFGTKTDDFNIKEVLADIYSDAVDGVINQGQMTGFVDYDRMTNGHKEGELIIVAARPSVGKTAYALNVAMGHMDNGSYGHIYSLEMGKKSLLNRMITAKACLDNEKMRHPKKRFNPDDWQKYSMAMSVIEKYDMYISDKSSVKISEIYARTRKIMRQRPNQKHFVIIDYLQLLQPQVRRNNRQEEVSEMSRALKNMARDLGIPVIALSQLSRGVEQRQDKRPMLSDLRESGSIEQDADVVAFLYRDDYYNKESESKNIIEIIIGKQREGPVGTVELAFIKEYNKFVNLDRRYSDE